MSIIVASEHTAQTALSLIQTELWVVEEALNYKAKGDHPTPPAKKLNKTHGEIIARVASIRHVIADQTVYKPLARKRQ